MKKVHRVLPDGLLFGAKMKYIYLYLMVINIVGFAVMGIDKAKAKRHAWRIPEKILFFCSLLGGSIGTWAGMYAFRHKTKHWYFVVGMPLIFFGQIAAAIFILRGYL